MSDGRRLRRRCDVDLDALEAASDATADLARIDDAGDGPLPDVPDVDLAAVEAAGDAPLEDHGEGRDDVDEA